jgi:hypothetical protein
MKRFLYVAVALSLALAVRLYPALSSGLPFSTDAWSPIRNAELILERTPLSLDSGVLDDYNRYWPANSLFGAAFSLVTGLKPMAAMAVGIPLAAALTVPIFYALTCRVGGSRRLAFFSSTLLATAYPYALFTAGVTKETYANPLYMLSILVFLGCGGWRGALLFAVASSALVMAHHLAALVALAVLASMALASSILRAGRGLSLDWFSLLLASILAAAVALYFGLYAHGGLKVALAPSDLLSAASYQALAFALALYLTLRPHRPSGWRTTLACIASAAIASLIAFLCTRRPITPGAPTLPGRYMLYAAPFILVAPLAALGLGGLRGGQGEGSRAPIFWLSTLLGLEAYAVFGGPPLGLTLAYRALNLMCAPLMVLSALGLHRLYEVCGGPRRRRAARAAAVVALTVIAALGSYDVYASVSLQERYMGYFWLYSVPEYRAAEWVKGAAGSLTVAGDVKTLHLLKHYFNVNVDAFQGLKYLAGGGRKPQILFTYYQMFKNGYVVYGGYSVDLPENWAERASSLNHVYSNGLANVYVG